MKFIRHFALSMVSMALLTACNNTTTEKMENEGDTLANKIENAVETAGDKISDIGKTDDTSFVQNAVKSNQMELRMLENGVKMGTAKEVKDAAKKMIADHEKLGQQMKTYAAKKNIPLDQDMDKDMNDINEQKGASWDKEWLNRMVDEHQKDISKFEDAQDDVNDPELKTMITEALPVLRGHLDMVTQLRDKMNK